MGQPPLDTRYPYVGLELQSEPFREFLRKANEVRALAGREPFEFTVAGMAAAMDDYHETHHPKDQPSPDEVQYQESTQLLRLAAKKFINPRGRFEDLRPEIDEILRRKYPASEELLSCPPAPPPCVSAAEETSSGGERSTAGGAMGCSCGALLSCPGCGQTLSRDEVSGRCWQNCPWCGTPLNKET